MSQDNVIVRKGTTYVFPESACIAARDDHDALILVEQFRQPTARRTLELPGGILRKDETPLACAVREFTEETGLASGNCRLLFTLDLDLSTAVHRTHVFAALTRDPTPLRTPEFRVKRIPPPQAMDMVQSGAITHAPTVAAILSIIAEY
ncbi:ADP-ribose pyrophosphatase [Bradyrhizobium sp. CIR48]|uniref:NUDIX hydrolase n=1 Tax=Bradyrhizobium sp. CIR48 TaxID=2663840 RepID=UPI0016062108|nr:NUDIX hydrolase [Bradyrhizobium sp. CIR48]MBB4422210.1 ADP-ribose pyrophosphatase [Bradyrhizobium sp. CIR48]